VTDREKKLMLGGAPIALAIVGWYLWQEQTVQAPADSAVSAVVASSIPEAETHLVRLRRMATGVPARDKLLEEVRNELAGREKGLISADTAPQAQAQLLQIVKRVAGAQSPPISLRNTEFGQVRAFGEDYGEVVLSLTFDAGIEQLVQFLSDLTAQPEAIGTTDLRVGTAHPKAKTVPVRLTLSGLVRGDLVPKKKEAV
jgi:hypothetical protein